MSIEALNCQCCGAPLKIVSSTCECEYCGSINIIGGEVGKYITQLNRANKLRQQCEFDHAYNIYDIILSETTPSVDILWSQALCEYGIEYVPDPVSSRYFPTLHRIKDVSFLNSRCFTEAMGLADDKQKEQLKKSAEEIEKIQVKYLNIAANERPYDAFICYKETDAESGEITEDVKLAEELYNDLKSRGFKVFFARETLKDKLSVNFEPYIFAALKSARAMAVIGTRSEYFTSVWVKNEWGRFLKLMETHPEKKMFFACDNPDELPRAFATKQAQVLGDYGAIKNLADNMSTYLKDPATSEYMTDQEKFDQIMAEKTEKYIQRINKTKFGEDERTIIEELWRLDGFAKITNNLYRYTFHIGAIILMITEFFNLFYAYFRLISPSDETRGPLLVFSIFITFLYFSGIVTVFSSILFVETFDFRKPNTESGEFLPIIFAHILTVLSIGYIVHLFLYEYYPVSDTIMIVVVPIVIFVIGFFGWINPSFKSNKKLFEEADVQIKKIKDLEEAAKTEFFEFASKQLEEYKQKGNIDSTAEIKDYHYDDVRAKVKKTIEEDTRFLDKMGPYESANGVQVKMRMIFTFIYSAISLFLCVFNMIIMYMD